MDMLSVLLREYGHALGLDHSADGTDFMAESLQPGQRKLPSAADLQLMAQLVAQLKGGANGEGGPIDPTTLALPAGIALAGLLGARRRPEEEGATPAPTLQKLLAINPALHNADFTQALAGAPANTAGVSANIQGWTTTGSVSTDTVNGSARITLSETGTSQTSLMQAFNLGANDRYLSFTVDGLNLNGGNTGPADAFEVALLDPTTYQPLLDSNGTGGLGWTHSDASLNLQATANGLAVLLSFDLLGFGTADSSVTLRDIRVGSAPQAVDDTLTVVEDTPTTFHPLANDVDAAQPGLVPTLASGPQHSSVVVNPDGSLTYTAAANYHGPDSFTYNVGPQDGGTVGVDLSNTATVHLTITPVNDAPTLQGLSITVTEDGAATLNPLASASDVDGDALQATVVAGPAHGTVTVQPGGHFTYQPHADYVGPDSFTYTVNDGELTSNVAAVSIDVTPVNDAPTLGHQALSVAEDTELTGNLLATAADVDSAALTALVIDDPAHGSLSVNADGSYTYKPNRGYTGTDSFTYTVSDGQESTTATISLRVGQRGADGQ